MNWLLITIIWIGPIGHTATGERFATESQCLDAAFYAKGEARCIYD